MASSAVFRLPEDQQKEYLALDRCMYCGVTTNLTDEHIIPLGLGGRIILPKSSCTKCGGKISPVERTCLRTMFGPLRMYYELPTRRRKERPKTLSLRVKVTADADWSYMEVDRDVYPFFILFPFLEIPDELARVMREGDRGAKVQTLWIRGASFRDGITAHLERLTAALNVREIMPTATVSAPDFFRLLAKIAHAFAVAESGLEAFDPFLIPMICDADTSNAVQYVGGMRQEEPASSRLHELAMMQWNGPLQEIVTVKVRLLAVLGTPTYFVAVGKRR